MHFRRVALPWAIRDASPAHPQGAPELSSARDTKLLIPSIERGVQHAFNSQWNLAVDWVHEQGVHAYARYQYEAGYTLFSPLFPTTDITDQMNNVPNMTVFRSDNRSRYDGMMVHLQGNVTRRFNLVANYTLSKAKTWGCVLGELFDYVDGVCNPLHAFGRAISVPPART